MGGGVSGKLRDDGGVREGEDREEGQKEEGEDVHGGEVLGVGEKLCGWVSVDAGWGLRIWRSFE